MDNILQFHTRTRTKEFTEWLYCLTNESDKVKFEFEFIFHCISMSNEETEVVAVQNQTTTSS